MCREKIIHDCFCGGYMIPVKASNVNTIISAKLTRFLNDLEKGAAVSRLSAVNQITGICIFADASAQQLTF